MPDIGCRPEANCCCNGSGAETLYYLECQIDCQQANTPVDTIQLTKKFDISNLIFWIHEICNKSWQTTSLLLDLTMTH